MRKRRVLILLLCALLALGLAGCGGGETPSGSGDAAPAEGETLTVVATIFPAYDWIRNLVGDVENVDVRLLCGDGTDLHSFQPSAADIVTIASADLFVYVGGESDAWVAEALAGTGGEGQQAIALLDALGGGALEEETVEGMEGEEEEESGEEAPEYDEHVWLSLKNAKQLCTEISGALQALDPANAEAYQANLEGYLDQLDALDGQYETAVKEGRVKTLLFADRFPFRYLTEDYGLDYYAAFSGCSAETEASFETVAFLAKKTEELNLGAVLTIETGDGKLAQTVVDAAGGGRKILTLDSMQAVTAEEAAAGATYLDIMEQNLAALKEALS